MYRHGRSDGDARSRNRVHSEVGTRENVAFHRDHVDMTPRSVQSRRTVPIHSSDLQEDDRHSMLLRRDSDLADRANPPVEPAHYGGLAPLVRRERSSSSDSSGSAFSAVTCPESLIPSDISLAGPLSSDDTGPVYPAFKMPTRRNTPAVRQADYVDDYADTDLLAEEFDKVDIYREDRRLPLLVSSPRPSPPTRTRPTSQQQLLSPLNNSPYLRSPESLCSTQSATHEREHLTPTHSSRAYANPRAVATPKQNGNARSVVVVPDSDDEEDKGRAGERRRSSLTSERRAFIARRWELLASQSPGHVQSKSHSSAFDPRSPMARGTSVPIDAV